MARACAPAPRQACVSSVKNRENQIAAELFVARLNAIAIGQWRTKSVVPAPAKLQPLYWSSEPPVEHSSGVLVSWSRAASSREAARPVCGRKSATITWRRMRMNFRALYLISLNFFFLVGSPSTQIKQNRSQFTEVMTSFDCIQSEKFISFLFGINMVQKLAIYIKRSIQFEFTLASHQWRAGDSRPSGAVWPALGQLVG